MTPRPPAAAGAGGGAVLHASCVAFEGRGVIVLGPAGTGKSALALMLIALGAALVADDRTLVAPEAGRLLARPAPGLPPWIEARGVGLLRSATVPVATLALAIDLGAAETERLPPRRVWQHGGIALPCVHGPATPHFPAAIAQYIRHGRAA